MFNLKSDLKIYTCDKYLMVQKILKNAIRHGDRYAFKVMAQVRQRKHDYANRYEDFISFVPEGMNESHFREFLQLAGVHLSSIESISTFADWAKANPDKSWQDFQRGLEAGLNLPADKLDAAFAKIRPDQLMNDLALSPNSRVAGLIGKSSGDGYRRRRRTAKQDRENQLVRLWTLFGTEVAISASSKQLEDTLNGIQLHDFGISHCENMQQVLNFVGEKVYSAENPDETAAAIKQLDAMIIKFGGKPPVRCRPRSPWFRQVYDILDGKPFNPDWNKPKANDIAV